MKQYDGYVSSHGVAGSQVTGQYPAYSKTAMSEGVVIARYAINDPGNVSKKYTEYDVRELRTGHVFSNCRRTLESGGVDGGDDIPLRPAKRSADLGTLNTGVFDPKQSPLLSSDGDHVMLAFLQGSQDSAVVCGVLPHHKSVYGNLKEDGDRQFRTHKGTSVETRADGSYVITRHLTPVAPGHPQKNDDNATTVTVAANGDIRLRHPSGAGIRILADGTVRIDAQQRIFLGDPVTDDGILDGVVHASGIDMFTGLTFGELGAASRMVMVEK